MRKTIIIVLTAVVLLGVYAIPVSAQGPASYQSTVIITNTSESEGIINLIFYNPDGSIADDSILDPIGALETKFYTTIPVSSGFKGSMVIESNVPLASTSTVIGKTNTGAVMNYANYVGVSTGAGRVFLPLLMKNNYGFNTYFSIQNTSGLPVDVEITYSDGVVVPAITGLQPGAAVLIDNLLEAGHVRKFAGTVEATGDIAIAVVEWADGKYGKQLFAYNGFTQAQGTPDPVIPMVNQNNYGYWTSIPIQNLGSQDTVVTLQYTPTKAGTACTETLTIPQGGWAEFGQNAHVFLPKTPGSNCVMGQRFVGVATVISNSTNQPLIGLMNQSTTIHQTWDKAGALMSMNRDLGSGKIVFPEAYQYFGAYNWWSSITIINVSGGTIPAGDLTCRGIGNVGSTPVDNTWSNPNQLADGEGWITDMERNWGPMPVGFIGSVTCVSATNANILGTLNNLGHTAPVSMDSFTMYEGINIYP